MSYERNSEIIIVILEATLTILKSIKKLRSLIKKKGKEDSLVNDI